MFSSVFSFCKTKGYFYWKHNIYRLCVQNLAPGQLQMAQKFKKWQWHQNFLTWRQCHFFDVVLFLLSSLVTGPSFMSISSLVLELWQFSFIRDWPEIRKTEIPPSEFCPISEDWGELWMQNLAWMSLIHSFSFHLQKKSKLVLKKPCKKCYNYF